MATKLQILAVAVLATGAIIANAISIDPDAAKEVRMALQDALSLEKPLMEDKGRSSKMHRNSLLRTGQHMGKVSAPVSVPSNDHNEWASDFEKDVSDLVLGIAQGGLSATPFQGSIDQIKDLIEKEMMVKVKEAHAADQKELNRIHSDVEGCGATKTEEWDEAIKFKTTYEDESKKHKTCRGEEAEEHTKMTDCHTERAADLASRDSLKKLYDEAKDKFGSDTTMQSAVQRTQGDDVEGYLVAITSKICGKQADCATCGNEHRLAGSANHAGNAATYTWHGGTGSGGMLDEFSAAKKAYEDAFAKHAQTDMKCSHDGSKDENGNDQPKGLDGVWLDKKESCDLIQDAMDKASCKWAIDTKDLCEKYEGCYSSHTSTYDTYYKLVKGVEGDGPDASVGQEGDRKAEWKGLMRMMCILDAFDGGINQTEIDWCKNQVHDVSHLDIVYPTIPSQTTCALVTLYPATAEYKTAEFVPLPVLAKGKVDANLCSGLQEVSLIASHKDVAPNCKCERVVMDGPYSPGPLVKCVDCVDVFRSEDQNSCPAGTKLFAPRTEKDWNTLITSLKGVAPLRDPNWIIDITRPQAGCIAGKCDIAMNSADAHEHEANPEERWVTSDHMPWWLRGSPLAPTGTTGITAEYQANCYLDLVGDAMPADEKSVTFKEQKCEYHSKSYYCQPKDVSLRPKTGSPAACTCRKTELTGAYSAETLVKCEKCHEVSKSGDTNSCPDGYKIFSPATREDWKTVLESIGHPLASPDWIIDVTRPQNGCGGCETGAMKFETANQKTWGTKDASQWWLSDDVSTDMTTDYVANCFLRVTRDPANKEAVDFKVDTKDGACNVKSKSYYCQPIVTTTTTTTTEANCASYGACQTANWVLKANPETIKKSTEEDCCQKTCAALTCTAPHWRKKTGNDAELVPVGSTTAEEQTQCCEGTCRSFVQSSNDCWGGWAMSENKADNVATTTNFNSECCEVVSGQAHVCAEDGAKCECPVGNVYFGKKFVSGSEGATTTMEQLMADNHKGGAGFGSAGVECSTTAFGGDPNPGVPKYCWCDPQGTTPAPEPTWKNGQGSCRGSDGKHGGYCQILTYTGTAEECLAQAPEWATGVEFGGTTRTDCSFLQNDATAPASCPAGFDGPKTGNGSADVYTADGSSNGVTCYTKA